MFGEMGRFPEHRVLFPGPRVLPPVLALDPRVQAQGALARNRGVQSCCCCCCFPRIRGRDGRAGSGRIPVVWPTSLRGRRFPLFLATLGFLGGRLWRRVSVLIGGTLGKEKKGDEINKNWKQEDRIGVGWGNEYC